GGLPASADRDRIRGRARTGGRDRRVPRRRTARTRDDLRRSMNVLDLTYYGNTIRAWLVAILLAAVAFTAFQVVKAALLRRHTRFGGAVAEGADEAIRAMAARTHGWWLLVFAAYIGSRILFFPSYVESKIRAAVVIALAVQGALWTVAVLDVLQRRSIDRRLAEDPSTVTTIRFLAFAGRVVAWTFFALLALSNLGISVTPVLTGLGIGGIAVALAVQNILGDLFASLSIVLDRPFIVGETIVVGDVTGTVERVGLKTTRLRGEDGEQIVFPNSELLRSRIRNFSRGDGRRVQFGVGVSAQTPHEKLARVPEIVREIVEARDGVRFVRAQLRRIGAATFDFEVVYDVVGPDPSAVLDIQQDVQLELVRRFEEEGITFADTSHPLRVLPIVVAAATAFEPTD